MIIPPGPDRYSTLALDRLLMSRSTSGTGFFNCLEGVNWDGWKEICSLCLPGRDTVGPPRERGKDTGVPIPEAGVDAREVVVLGVMPLVEPLTPLAVTEAGFFPQVGATGVDIRGLAGP